MCLKNLEACSKNEPLLRQVRTWIKAELRFVLDIYGLSVSQCILSDPCCSWAIPARNRMSQATGEQLGFTKSILLAEITQQVVRPGIFEP